jgi:hypothetical protein
MSYIEHFYVLKDALVLLHIVYILTMRHAFVRECAEEVMQVSVKSRKGQTDLYLQRVAGKLSPVSNSQ